MDHTNFCPNPSHNGEHRLPVPVHRGSAKNKVGMTGLKEMTTGFRRRHDGPKVPVTLHTPPSRCAGPGYCIFLKLKACGDPDLSFL